MIRSVNPTEHQIQCAIVEWANTNKYDGYKTIGFNLIAIPNGGNRSITEGVRLKREGVTAGVSDLFLAIPITGYRKTPTGGGWCGHLSGLWLEVKTKKGKVSEKQQSWMRLMRMCGYEAVVVKSIDEGIQAIKDYLGMK